MDPVSAVERAIVAIGDDPLKAWITVDVAGARDRAAALAREGPAGKPLFGLVASVKDNLAVRGLPMTCGSRHLERYVAPYHATVVERLERAGAVIVGKTNMDEFAAGSSGENSAFGPTRNPRDPERVPGGSSSGAAASVGAGHVDLALGSDTGGSIRAPASFCGVVGFKPTYGAVSRYGLADLAMSLEGPGPLARSVLDAARLFDAIAGADPRDTRTLAAPQPITTAAVEAASPKAIKIGVIKEFHEGVAPEVLAPVRLATERLARAGATTIEVSIPQVKLALPAYYLLNYSEFASAMQKLDGLRYGTPGAGRALHESEASARATFGREVKRRVLLGTYATSREERKKWYDRTITAKAEIARAFDRALADVDVLVGPTMPFPAFPLGSRIEDPLAMYAADVLTVTANLAGIPAGSVPLHVDGLPVGYQVMGRRGEDARVLAAMRLVEKESGLA